ncbi:MAG TPA: YdiU family protein [Spongiibacteraceae bacterium]|nr:YdiU family protein [Spongiibacteraceae bacterium]
MVIRKGRRHNSAMQTLENLQFDNSFARLSPTFYTRQQARGLDNPRLVVASAAAAELLNLDPAQLDRLDFVQYFSGNRPLPGAEPLAMVYAGHQFGQYAGQLGDGRGLLLGEVVSESHGRWDLHLKGAGKTPYSRFGDGRAVLRSSIREFLCSEAMAALGIPSSRALCVIDSDTRVQREQIERGAMVLRLARSHVRFGHFEHFHYTEQPESLRELADYVVARHYPEFIAKADRHAELLRQATLRTATLIAHWQAVGFAHGVLNTDNMSIVGDTFDYGPFGFLDDFDPTFICNHSDDRGRYSFERQPSIGLWNLNALAHALSGLIDIDTIRSILQQYEPHLIGVYSQLMRNKLGLVEDRAEDTELLSELLQLLASNHSDYTLFFRRLCDFDESQAHSPLRDDFVDRERFDRWAQTYRTRLQQQQQTREQRSAAMQRANPKFILRNYLAQQAIEKAEQGDYSEVQRLFTVLQNPYDEQPGNESYAAAPPDWGKHLAVSCSS